MVDRHTVIARHDPLYTKLHQEAPLSVGNGVFCFTADCTGLQTFFDEYAAVDDAFPLCTMAEWAWHSYPPLPEDKAGLRLTPYDTYGRTVYYATDDTGQEESFKRIRQSAHKFDLARIGFQFEESNLSLDECKPVSQKLSLWEGVLCSEFSLKGDTIKTTTFVHPDEDALYVRVVSPLPESGKLRIKVTFPYASHKKTAADFDSPARHTTRLDGSSSDSPCAFDSWGGALRIRRELDDTQYRVTLGGRGFAANVSGERHAIALYPNAQTVEFCVRFEPVRIPQFDTIGGIPAVPIGRCPDSFDEAMEKCKGFWERYWNNGGIVDFSESTDSRAAELERRIVLSQYLIAIQSRGHLPPAETGLTCNSWYGKFHLEMHYWHHAHFALWGRVGELKQTLAYYKKILPLAREIAASQGYAGARWPKMCDPSGNNTPSSVAVLLIWQQPHPIMLAELCWRTCPEKGFLAEYRDVVVQTAEFMKSFLHWEESAGCYVIGPPYIPAQERHDPKTVLNAAYELEYFRWGLLKADEWLQRLGEPGCYGQIAEKLSLPAVKDGVYLAHENCPETFNKFYTDHPSMLAMFGVLNSEKIDCARMSATLDKVLEVWDKKTFYGWDFPMMAMTACRLGRWEDAVDLLLMDSPKNTFMANGHNRMVGDNALPLYLPGNGGLLIAVAMMAAGFGEKKGRNCFAVPNCEAVPSFPAGFSVRTEGIHAYI